MYSSPLDHDEAGSSTSSGTPLQCRGTLNPKIGTVVKSPQERPIEGRVEQGASVAYADPHRLLVDMRRVFSVMISASRSILLKIGS